VWSRNSLFYTTQCSLLCPITGPYVEPVESSLKFHILFILGSILILSSHLRVCLPRGYFPSHFHTKILYAFLTSHMRPRCPAHPIPFDLIALIISGEEYKLRSFSLCIFTILLLLPVISCFLPSILCSHTPTIYILPLKGERPSLKQ